MSGSSISVLCGKQSNALAKSTRVAEVNLPFFHALKTFGIRDINASLVVQNAHLNAIRLKLIQMAFIYCRYY